MCKSVTKQGFCHYKSRIDFLRHKMYNNRKEVIKMTKKEIAVEYKHNACNCAQAVIAAYCKECGITLEQAKRLGAGFGLGMGTTYGTCGALCGAQTVLGIKMYNGASLNPISKILFNQFEMKCGSTVCRELKGIDTGRMPCSCDDCVANAVEALEQVLNF